MSRCAISSFPAPPSRHINCHYLTNTIPHVTSAHLRWIQKSVDFCTSPTSSTSLLPLPPPSLPLMLASTPLQSDNQLWRFSPGFRPTIGCFSTRGKNAPCPPHDRPRPGRHCPGRLGLSKLGPGLSKLENCSPEEVQLCVLLLLAISPPRNVGGRLVEVGS